MLFPWFCWHENKSCILVYLPYPKRNFWFGVNGTRGDYVICHPVLLKKGNRSARWPALTSFLCLWVANLPSVVDLIFDLIFDDIECTNDKQNIRMQSRTPKWKGGDLMTTENACRYASISNRLSDHQASKLKFRLRELISCYVASGPAMRLSKQAALAEAEHKLEVSSLNLIIA